MVRRQRPHPALVEARRRALAGEYLRTEDALAEGARHGIDTKLIAAIGDLCRAGAEDQHVADSLGAVAAEARCTELELREHLISLLEIAAEGATVTSEPAHARWSTQRRRLLRWIMEQIDAGRRKSPPVAPYRAPLSRPIESDASGDDGTTASAAPHPSTKELVPAVTDDERVSDVAVRMLGPLEIDVHGRRLIDWRSLKGRAVLQYLLLQEEGRPVRREVLMELLWPGHSAASARNNLNVSLYAVRRALEGYGPRTPYVLYKDGCYMLNRGLSWWIDREQFLHALALARPSIPPRERIDAYLRATTLYRGRLFEDDATGEWFLPERRHLEESYLEALENLAELYLARGEVASAVAAGERTLHEDCCRESGHRLLMRCHASRHQQQLVCRQFELCKATLRDELGVAPTTQTVQLYRQLVGVDEASPAP